MPRAHRRYDDHKDRLLSQPGKAFRGRKHLRRFIEREAAIAEQGNTRAFQERVQRWLATFRDSHLEIRFPVGDQPDEWLPFSVEVGNGGRLFVASVDPTLVARLPLGAVIEAVDGESAEV